MYWQKANKLDIYWLDYDDLDHIQLVIYYTKLCSLTL